MDHNPHFLITLCITIRDYHDALLDLNTLMATKFSAMVHITLTRLKLTWRK